MQYRKVWTFAVNVLMACFLATTSCNIAPPKPAETAAIELPPENLITYKIYIDDKFSGVERDLVIMGFNEWERATVGVIAFDIQERGHWNSDDDFLHTPVADPKTHVLKCTKDLYVARVYNKDEIVQNIQNTIKEQSKEELLLAGYATPECKHKFFLIVADRISDVREYVAVTVHEMGHMLGLQHLKIENMTTMYPGLQYGTACVTALDTDQLCKLWKCDRSKMKPCVPGKP